MRTHALGSSGIVTSSVGFGAWAAGGWMWGGADADDAVAAIRAAVDAGVTLIDTAPMYGYGRSEELVGAAVKGMRDKVVLATKCGLVWHTERGDYNFDADADTIVGQGEGTRRIYRCLAPDVIRHELEQSLRRLGTDYVDLYQTHWQETKTPRAETMRCLLDLKKEGKIRAIGVSNVSREQLDDYLAVGPVDSAQERYSLLDRKQDEALLPYVKEKGIAFLCYSPLEQGLLSGRAAGRTFNAGDQRLRNKKFQPDYLKRLEPLLTLERDLAAKHKATPGQIAVAWTLSRPGVTHTLVGARNAAQARENADAGRIELGADEAAALTQAAEAVGAP